MKMASLHFHNRIFCLVVVVGAGLWLPDASSNDAEPIRTLDTVVVTGTAPGPGMWKVSNDGHTLWILGTLKPVPASIAWDSAATSDVISKATLVLWEPSFTLDVDAGVFGKLSLGYSYLKARNNPDGQTLREVLPPDVHARWQRLRDRYLRGRGGMERKRPMSAAEELLEAAITERGLSSKNIVTPIIVDAVKSGGIGLHSPGYTLKISRKDASALLKDVRASAINDVACLTATMDVVEHGMDRIITNANAWAVGDIDRIDTSLTARRDMLCTDTLSSASAARERGLPDIRSVMQERWVAAAAEALKAREFTVAVLPISDLIAEEGYLHTLRQLGYDVESP